MKIVQLIPGAGNTFYCENCLRDNGLAKVLRKLGHEVRVAPLYLPILTDESNVCSDIRIFFGGINVYLQQKSALFRKTPRWIDQIFDSPKLLKWAAGKASMTRYKDLAETTLSMLHGEEGRQVKELERLVAWLSSMETPPNVIHISNALLLGMVRRIKEELHVPVICSLQDEDILVDALPESYRQIVWETISQCAADVDAFISVSNYYKDFMCARIKIPADRVHVVYNGINLEGYELATLPDPPMIGYLERQCREKGLDMLIDAFVILKEKVKGQGGKRGIAATKLRIAGGKTTDDEPFLHEMRQRLDEHGLGNDVEFLPNLTREEKLAFLKNLSVLSVPAEHKEAFGVYILEALASGVPVALPRHGAFPELLKILGGGILCEPNDAHALANAIETLLLDPEHARELGMRGRKTVFENFSVERMAHEVAQILEKVVG